MNRTIVTSISLLLLIAQFTVLMAQRSKKDNDLPQSTKIHRSDQEWKALLSADQYNVLRKKGTERAFTSPLNQNKQKGTYRCAGCKSPLFSSAAKFESGTGWPSFYEPINKRSVTKKTDYELGMIRTEVLCAVCSGHLGHVFEDGPPPTGLRYCMNGIALQFEKEE